VSWTIPIDPLKPHVTIAIAAPEPRFSKGVRVVSGGYGGETNEEIRAHFQEICGAGPGMTEVEGWRIVDLPYDHGEWMPDDAGTTRSDERNEEPFLREAREVFDDVLKEDDLPVG
jgi:hypothetical protein